MMAGEHPSEAKLFAYVEDELEGAERATVETHLAVCATCAENVALVRLGREALQRASLLELPQGTREWFWTSFPRREAPARMSGRRLVALVVPIAAALAVVAGVATLTTGDDNGDGAPGDAAVAEERSPAAGESATDNALEEETTRDGSRFALVGGDPDDVARDLRRRGFEARVQRGTVVVRTDRTAALERALADLPPGPVRVRVE